MAVRPPGLLSPGRRCFRPWLDPSLTGAPAGRPVSRCDVLEPMQSELIRVLIVDGDALICRALVRLLRDAPDVGVVATATDASVTLELAEQFRPAVALLDAGTARLDGMTLMRSLRQQAPATRVVVLSVYATMRDRALAAGACRFLLKDSGRDELLATIRLAARGQCQSNGEAGLDQGEAGQ
jgi:DNA-binding NarL/FixJ family response regulator